MTTALGAAYLAGMAAGVWSNKEELVSKWKLDVRFEPQMAATESKKLYKGWKKLLIAPRIGRNEGHCSNQINQFRYTVGGDH